MWGFGLRYGYGYCARFIVILGAGSEEEVTGGVGGL